MEPQVKSSAGTFAYVPALDGLRACSIMLVMAFHELGPATSIIGQKLNGWAGVDLFFIISGFLITSILLKERDRDGDFSLKNFYVRRWLRICPAYYLFLAAMFGFMLIRGHNDFAAYAIAGFYLTNLDMAFGWGLLPARTGLMHTWSLSVEEQFYLLWPAALKMAKDRALKLCVGLIAFAYCWRLILLCSGASWGRLAVGLDTKLDSIMYGVLVAFLWRSPQIYAAIKAFCANSLAQWTSVAAVLISLACLGHPGAPSAGDPMIFWAIKMPATLISMTALLVTILANPSTGLGKFLSSKPMVFVGRLSYSLYLWHIIVNIPEAHAVFADICHRKRYMVEIAKYAFCFSIASASYFFVEQPFLKLKSKFS